MSRFKVPFVCKGPASYDNEGFQICAGGMIVMDAFDLTVFGSYGSTSDSEKILNVPVMDIDNIKCMRFISNGGHFYGGRVEIIGFMGQEWKEKLVMKMEWDEFVRFKTFLKSLAEEEETAATDAGNTHQ
jgi:hypothetical protein